jgi:hypothetical protein
MLNLIIRMLTEAVIGLALAAVALGLSVPLLLRYNLIAPGDLIGSLLIAGVIAGAIGIMLLRPGSVLNRHRK